ncbi:MAG TPA: ATP-binding protein [Pseudobdellovibrionaceae bacterium]
MGIYMVDVESIKNEFQNNPSYKPYITSIVFHYYKNLTPDSELKFEFPLTLLIGKNGTNKSSILHALYGCPEGKSTGEYWFSTHIDPIDNTEGKRAAYFYRYTVKDLLIQPEVLKSRMRRTDDPDYWETARPKTEYGMLKIPPVEKSMLPYLSKTHRRWNPIHKAVHYLDFRAEISAFDKAFYKDSNSESRAIRKKRIRNHSKALKVAIEEELKTKIYFKKNRIFSNNKFTRKQREIVNNILATEYSEIVYIEHDFYLSGSFSVYIKKNDENNNYSEAFAGSGETSIVRLVYALENSEEGALILLDEPETSLHIEAQSRLRDYLLHKIREKHLQVIISTHSPYFAKGLPDCAIKILDVDSSTKKINIINEAPAEDSSFYLGYQRNVAEKTNIIVEDRLAKAIVKKVYSEILSPNIRDKIALQIQPGGATQMLRRAVIEMSKPYSNEWFLFDGDQKLHSQIPDPSDIPESKNNKLESVVAKVFGHCPDFPSLSNSPERIQHMRRFLAFAKERFLYLPFQTPEEFIVQNNLDEFKKSQNKPPKDVLRDYCHNSLGSTGDVNGDGIFTIQRFLLSKISIKHDAFQEIKQQIGGICKSCFSE